MRSYSRTSSFNLYDLNYFLLCLAEIVIHIVCVFLQVLHLINIKVLLWSSLQLSKDNDEVNCTNCPLLENGVSKRF